MGARPGGAELPAAPPGRSDEGCCSDGHLAPTAAGLLRSSGDAAVPRGRMLRGTPRRPLARQRGSDGLARLGPARPGSALLGGLGSGQPDPVQLLRSVCGRAAGGRQTIAAAETPAIYHGNKICTVMWSNCSFRFQRELKAGKSRLESSKL